MNDTETRLAYADFLQRKKDALEFIEDDVALLIISIDLDDDKFGHILYATSRVCELFGYFRDELSLKQPPLHDLIPDRDGIRDKHDLHLRMFAEHPEGRPMGALQMALTGWNRLTNKEFTVEIELSTGKMFQGRRSARAIIIQGRK